MILMGWDYPENNGLKDIIEKLQVYPITILARLTKREKQILITEGIVTCSQLKEDPSVLDKFRLPEARLKPLLKEIGTIHGHK